MNKKFRGGLVLASVVAMAVMTGCSTTPPQDLLKHDFTETLAQPRPETLEESVAMRKMYTEFSGYSNRALGCLMDTAIWEDEEGIYNGGFDVLRVFEATIGWHYPGDFSKKEHLKPLLDKHGTVPGVIKYNLENWQGNDYLGRFAVNAENDYHFDTGFNKFGLALSGAIALVGMVSDSQKRIAERLRIKDFTYTILSYRLTQDEEKDLASKGLLDMKSQKNISDLTDFYIEKIFSVITDSVKELGYEIVGDRVTTTQLEYNAKTFYPIEGIGCPKANQEEPWKACYVGMGAGKYEDGSSWYIVIGRDGKTASTVFDWRYDYNIYGPNHTTEVTQNLYQKMEQIILRKNPNVTFYFPPEEIKGKWYPNRVVDKTGTYYFVIPVKRTAEATKVIDKEYILKVFKTL